MCCLADLFRQLKIVDVREFAVVLVRNRSVVPVLHQRAAVPVDRQVVEQLLVQEVGPHGQGVTRDGNVLGQGPDRDLGCFEVLRAKWNE